MVRKQISLFLKNVPGELGRLAVLLAENKINLEALSIQDASAYVMELFQARGKSIKRIASTNSYDSVRKDSEEFALIRLLVKEDETDRAVEVLAQNDYMFDVLPVIAVGLDNKTGALAEVAARFGREGINIKYVYGSALCTDEKALFVFCPEDIDHAAKFFGD
ncbi:MAG: amino acid-binding protein [Pseudomonadota bacterium]